MSGFPRRLEDAAGPTLRVRHTDRTCMILGYLFFLVACAAFLLLVWSNETVITHLERLSPARDERATLLVGFSLVFAALVIDFLLLLQAFVRRRPALVIDPSGVGGLHGGLWRTIGWDDLHEVERRKAAIRLVRRPRSALTRLSFAMHRRLTRHRLEYCIHVPLRRVDASRSAILAALRAYRSDLVPEEDGGPDRRGRGGSFHDHEGRR